MPQLRLFLGVALAALCTMVLQPLSMAVAWAAPFWDIAFSPRASWDRPADAFCEVVEFSALRARARSFRARRLQREPLDLSAGCGLRLAA